jgi:ribosome maturation protein Sdo1
LDEILHTKNIYKNVSKGELANKADLKRLGLSEDKIIEEILKYGVEKKDEKTRSYELEKIEKEITFFIQKRIVDKNNKYLSDNFIKELMRRSGYIIDTNRNFKVQSIEIIKIILNSEEYKRLSMKVEVIGIDQLFRESLARFDSLQEEESCGKFYVYISSDEFKRFKEICERMGVKYVILTNSSVVEEEIC